MKKFYLIILPLLFLSCTTKQEKDLTISCAKSFLTAAVWVAEYKEYFKDEGINITIKEHNSGKESFNAMLNSESDISTVAQTPIVTQSFVKDDFLIISAMVTSYKDIKVLTKKDSVILLPKELKGKSVGLTKGSTGEYFFDLFLTYYGVDKSTINIVDYKPQELKNAIVNGEVDSIVSWEPNILNAMEVLGENSYIIPSEEIYREDFHFVANKKLIKDDPDTIVRFLKAMDKAIKFISFNRDKSIDIVTTRLQADKELTYKVWDNFNFQLLLDQSILSSLEDEARWLVDKGAVETENIPNYLNYIYAEALKSVKPEVVTLVH